MRAKYLDWCSAQLADHFLALSPDEIFDLAERASREGGSLTGRSLSASPEPTDLSSYRGLVERVTEVLTRQLDLPDYDEWLDLYRSDPEAVEEQLLGFWREST